MKRFNYIFSGLLILASCATSKVQESSTNGSENIRNTFQQGEIRQAVEKRRFLIKFDRLYTAHGGIIDLIPKANYLILDGDKVVISAAYIGRQYSYLPIKGIDMIGQTISFEIKNNESKGTFDIRMKVKNDKNTFDVYLTISDDGHCNTSLVSYKIDRVRYSGNLIPLKPKEDKVEPANVVI